MEGVFDSPKRTECFFCFSFERMRGLSFVAFSWTNSFLLSPLPFLLLVGICFVGEDGVLFSVKKFVKKLRCHELCGCGFNGMNEFWLCVGSDMGFHSELIVGTFWWNSFRDRFFLVLRGGRSFLIMVSISASAVFYEKSFFFQYSSDDSEHFFREMVFFQEVSELSDGRLIKTGLQMSMWMNLLKEENDHVPFLLPKDHSRKTIAGESKCGEGFPNLLVFFLGYLLSCSTSGKWVPRISPWNCFFSISSRNWSARILFSIRSKFKKSRLKHKKLRKWLHRATFYDFEKPLFIGVP